MAKSAKQRRHVPQRTCVVCRTVMPKCALVRIVATPDEGVLIDPTGKRAGRGAYLCGAPACWERAVTTDVLNHALRTTLSDAERERLRDAAPQPDAV